MYVVLPPEADYSGIARNNEVTRNASNFQQLFFFFPMRLSSAVLKPVRPLVSQSLAQLTCSYETENQTRYLSCDLGNPMKSGTSVRTQLTFGSYCPFKGCCTCSVLSEKQSTQDFLLLVKKKRKKSCLSPPQWVWTAQDGLVRVRKCYDSKYRLPSVSSMPFPFLMMQSHAATLLMGL